MLIEKSRLEEAADRRDGIDLVACGARPADVWEGLAGAMELLRAVLPRVYGIRYAV